MVKFLKLASKLALIIQSSVVLKYIKVGIFESFIIFPITSYSVPKIETVLFV